MKTKRQINFARIEEENPELARLIRYEKFLKNFNKEWKDAIEDDIFAVSSHIRMYSERDGMYGRLAFI